MPSWEAMVGIVAGIGAFLILAVLLIQWLLSKAESGAIAKDDLKEAEKSAEATARAHEAMREAPKTEKDLAADLRRKFGLHDDQ